MREPADATPNDMLQVAAVLIKKAEVSLWQSVVIIVFNISR